MTIFLSSLFAIFWFVCMIYSFGETFAFFQRNFPCIRKEKFNQDIQTSWFFCLFGPINMLIMRILTYPTQGWLWPWSKKAKQEAGLC